MVHAQSDRGSSTPNVHADAWSREETDDGRVYYFNRATGASQWHTPNELYTSKCLIKRAPSYSKDNLIKMPGSARAVLRVDCVTELPFRGNQFMHSHKQEVAKKLAAPAPERVDISPTIVAQPVLRVFIAGARDLRNTDMMGSKDKSDPYCAVEIAGKPETAFRTKTTMDNLNPTWNHVQLMPEYEDGDTLLFKVWDDDHGGGVADEQIWDNMCGSGAAYFSHRDDLLGTVEVEAGAVGQGLQQRALLDADDDDDIDSYLTFELRLESGFPGLKGARIGDAVYEVERAYPNVKVEPCEIPDPGCKVASFDRNFKQLGYSGNFVGMYADSAAKLRPGSVVELGGRRYTVESLAAETPEQKSSLRPVRYVYFTEGLQATVRDGAVWRKVTKEPEEGHDDHRVVIWYDFNAQVVTEIPLFG